LVPSIQQMLIAGAAIMDVFIVMVGVHVHIGTAATGDHTAKLGAAHMAVGTDVAGNMI
jgi:hypothetical protein